MLELLTRASCRKDWERISAESSRMSPDDPVSQGTELNWKMFRVVAVHRLGWSGTWEPRSETDDLIWQQSLQPCFMLIQQLKLSLTFLFSFCLSLLICCFIFQPLLPPQMSSLRGLAVHIPCGGMVTLAERSWPLSTCATLYLCSCKGRGMQTEISLAKLLNHSTVWWDLKHVSVCTGVGGLEECVCVYLCVCVGGWLCVFVLLCFYTPPPKYGGGGCILESLCPSVCLSFCLFAWVCLDDISCTTQPFLSKLGMVVYYHEAECHAQKLVHYLQCLGHSKGFK